jgi:hypothetical protein
LRLAVIVVGQDVVGVDVVGPEPCVHPGKAFPVEHVQPSLLLLTTHPLGDDCIADGPARP